MSSPSTGSNTQTACAASEAYFKFTVACAEIICM